MQEQTMAPVAKPMTAFHDALNRIEGAHDRVLRQERELLAERSRFDQLRAELETAYQAAVIRAQELGEAAAFPEHFSVGGLLITFDENGGAAVQQRAVAETYELITWARKAGEEK